MANLPPGDPKLVSQIVNHLKSQGLFDQFRRDCLADVDTKPAYQNLRQRVDNFVTNHLASHTWSPHLNKNQLRNNIRQQVLKSGMLESGIDRIISQVVDPKINHTFRPQVEKVVQEFLATLNNKEDACVTLDEHEERAESFTAAPGSLPVVAASTSVASDAMSILETISSLNQEATAARALTETSNHKNEKAAKKLLAQQSIDVNLEKDHCLEDPHELEKPVAEVTAEANEAAIKQEDVDDMPPAVEEVKLPDIEADGSIESKDAPCETEEQRLKAMDKSEKKPETIEKTDRKEEKKESKLEKKNEHVKKSDEGMKVKEEKPVKERDHEVEQAKHTAPEKNSVKQKINEVPKDELSLDSDLDACSDITVSSVHTSDLSSFDEESDEESAVSDSTEEGEITSDDEDKMDVQSKPKAVTEQSDPKPKATRHSYVHKPFLYSKYYSDSDDELTVEQRRQSAAKEKEERMLRRRMKRERLEEKRKLKAAEKKKALKMKSQGIEPKSPKGITPKSSSIKEVLKEQMFLEKKVALSKKKSRDSRTDQSNVKDTDEDSKESEKKSEIVQVSFEKAISSPPKEVKPYTSKSDLSKPFRKLLDAGEDPRPEKDPKKKVPLLLDRSQQDNETRDSRKLAERRDSTTEDQQKQKILSKPEKHSKKEGGDGEMQNKKSIPKKDPKLLKTESERLFSEDRLSSRHRSKSESTHKGSEDFEHRVRKKEDDILHKHGQNKSSSEERSDRKSKPKNDLKPSTLNKDEKAPSTDHKYEEDLLKDSHKRERYHSIDKSKSEHRFKRSLSDARPHRDSQSSSKHHSSSQRKAKTHSEDKNDGESANSDSSSKLEEGSHKDKRRTTSMDEKLSSKTMKNSKPVKPSDQEDVTQKSEREKSSNGGSVEKHRKPKPDEKDGDSKMDSVPQTSNSISKESGHKSKHTGEKAKERTQSENRERLSTKMDKKYVGENGKSSSSRHSQKDIKRREDGSKYEEKTGKSDDRKSRERGSSIDGKSNKKSIIELKGEASKATLVKKSSKVESENEGVGSPGDRVKVSTSSVCTEAKEEMSSSVGHSTESAEARQAVDLKEAAEPVVEDSLTASNSQDLHPHSEASKGFSLKYKSKHGSIDSKPGKLSNTCRKVSPIIPTVDFHTTDNLITLTPCENARKRVPCSNTAADVSNGGTENARNSGRKSRNANHDPQTSASQQQSSAQESVVCDRSSLNPFATLREISVLNDSEISTSDSTNREEDYSQERAVTESSSSKPVPEEVSELDNTVSGNDVEDDSVLDVDVTDSNGVHIADDPVFHEEENVCVSVSCAEASVQSSILQTNMGGTNNVSPTFSRNVPSLRIFDHVSRTHIEGAATSSSMSVITPTSSVIQTANSRSDGTNSENVRVSFGIFREYTASTTADDGNYSGDVDVAMLSDNSFEGASTSSSNCQATCTEGLFSDTSQATEKDTATSSQGANYVSLEEARSSDNSAVDAATSSVANRIISGDSQDNAATSSDNAEMNAGTLEISEVITRAATSSDGTPEIDSVPVVSEDGVMHAATSSDSVAESETVESASENVISHLATSSDSASESDDGAPGVSENVIGHAATSSSNVVDSSRGLNAEGSVASSETDNENSAASSSNFMDSSLSASRMWLKKSSERDEDAASSSSAPTRNRQIEHKVTGFENVEDGRNINATSSTQHDGAFDDRFMEVMSSGTVKEYPANSSDVAMDSSSEASGSVRRDMHSGSSSSCTSSGRAQSHAECTERDQEKAKYNDTASSSAEDIVALRTPFHVSNDEAASSSSSYTYNPMLHTIDNGALSSENTEAAASSSFVMNSSSQCVAVVPGNSSDNTATSSNSTDVGAADVCEVNLGNTQATTSSSVAMDSSTGEDLDTRIVSGTDHRSNTATSSSSPSTIPKETRVGPSEKDIRVTASSSTVAGASTNESLDTVRCVERSNDNAATSSDMMDVRIENRFHALSNNTICATTSTNNKSDAANAKEMDGGFIVCEINSEATAATSSSAVDNSGDNATSSSYLMECNAEGQSASQTTCPSKQEEAASSSGLFSGRRLQEIRTQEPVSNEATEDATSSERSSEQFLGSRDTIESKDTDIAEGAAESSFEASRNGSSNSLAGTAEQSVQLLFPSTNSDAELAVNSEDAANHASHKSSDEKEDAVSSASSEEQRICCNNPRQSNLQTGEVETDGAVTSVGTEMNDSSINESIVASGLVAFPHSGDHDVGQAAAACEDEESAVSHTSDAEVNENRAYEINPEDVVLEESESALSPENGHEIVVNVGAEPEAERPINSVMLEEGEGAVTSTGITEENYSEKRRPGIGEGDSSCSCTEMDMANVQNRQEPRDLGAIIEDDETAITSTGAKDEEEGEGFVTSTGTASEDSSFSSGVEENTNNGVINISEMSSENVYVDEEKDQPDLSGPEEAEESTGEQEMLQNADDNTLTIASGGSTGVISVSSQGENGSGQVSCEDICDSEHTSILKDEQEVESENTLTQELMPVGLDQIGPPVLTNKNSEPSSCTNDIVVDQDGIDANCELSDNSAVVSPEELDTSVTCVRDELDDMDSRSVSDREASSFTADAPVSPPLANEPVEPASHHADIGTAPEPVEQSSCEFSDDGSLDPETGKNKTSSLTEDTSRELGSEKTEDGEKEEDGNNVSITDARPANSVSECNPVTDLSGVSEETKNEDSLTENQGVKASEETKNEEDSLKENQGVKASEETKNEEDSLTENQGVKASEETKNEEDSLKENQGESNSEIANEGADVSCQENEILQDISQTNDSSTDNKKGDNEDDTTTFTNVEAEQNGQETTVLSKGVSIPSEKAPATQSQETPEPHQPEEKCTVEKDESGSPRLLEPSEQETAAQSSEANEEQTPVHQKKSRGRKRLEKVKDEEKLGEEANETFVQSLKTEEIEPKAEPDKRKRGRPPKKRKLSETLEQTVKNKLSSGGSSTEGQDKSEENAQGRKVTPDAVTPEKTVGKSEDNSEKGSEPVRRRGRKPKLSMSSSETEGSDPEKKRKRSQSEEEKNDDEEGSENEDEDEDDHRGATTRAASRLEAQRKLPHKPTTRAASKLGSPEPSASKERRRKEKTSPESASKRTAILKSKTQQAHGAKRLREASPPLVRTRTQQTQDVPAKRIKRQ